MPPRFAYWTIVAGGLPTAFRAAEREELLPTFKRIQEKHPDAEMKYFARGKLWPSQEEARREAEARRAAAVQRQSARGGTSRGRDWRPGGEHRDPRQKFKDAKKDRNLEWRKQRFERRQTSGTTNRPGTPDRPPNPNRPAERPARPDWRERAPRAGKPQGEWRDRPPGAGKPQGQWRDRPPRPKSLARPPKPGEVPKPAPPSRPTRPAIRPSGPPDRGRRGWGPIKDRRRRS